ncbi:hypothetical protein L484_007856 [Morus notabilis]|uniref:Uncharacterized protein n=1 Tax=Morus notabilis TaxID=981085 RepID=W9RUW1_9ROSA|nr:hypothetical protein L484_007856 [Morus notabilis]
METQGLWPAATLATSTAESRARPLGRADRQATACGHGGMKTSGGQGRRIRKYKKKKNYGRRQHLLPPALWMPGRNLLASPVTGQPQCTTAAAHNGSLEAATSGQGSRQYVVTLGLKQLWASAQSCQNKKKSTRAHLGHVTK